MEKGGICAMKMMILGAGFSGKAIGRACAAEFEVIYGTSRSPEKFAPIQAAGLVPLVFDGEQLSPPMVSALADVTHLVQSIAPDDGGDRFLRQATDLRALMPKLAWIGYLSTIGVYGNRDGAWVDETAEPTPLSRRSRERVDAERQWLEAGQRCAVPVAVLRLSGIYGPGRNAFLNLANGTARRLVKASQVFNRIRAEDIGRATKFLLDREIGGIFNITDHHPSPSQDVVEFAARLMGVEVPPDIPFEQAELSPMARSFYAENKRVSNAKIRALGFEFAFPDYEQSLKAMWADGNWRGE
jgi:nucleoside-diphosphate-sugar epimerase